MLLEFQFNMQPAALTEVGNLILSMFGDNKKNKGVKSDFFFTIIL